jgi:hypothetical protein
MTTNNRPGPTIHNDWLHSTELPQRTPKRQHLRIRHRTRIVRSTHPQKLGNKKPSRTQFLGTIHPIEIRWTINHEYPYITPRPGLQISGKKV